MNFLRLAKQCLKPHLPADCSLWGPVMAPMAKRGGRYRAQLMLQHKQRKGRTALLAHWLKLIEDLAEARKVRWSLDVDPLSMY
jgi:primosomal protein N' (replication factor Y)